MIGFKKFAYGCSAAALALSLVIATPALAEGEEAEGPNLGKIGVSAGIDWTSAYWFRGMAQQNEGLIGQPWLDISFELTDWASFYAGVWNSLHNKAVSGASADVGKLKALFGGPEDSAIAFNFHIHIHCYDAKRRLFMSPNPIG